MARKVKDRSLYSADARSNLKLTKEQKAGKPVWRELRTGLHLGWRKTSGTWIARRLLTESERASRGQASRYHAEKIGLADDTAPADGRNVFSFDQAQDLAHAWFARQIGRPNSAARGTLTVRQAFEQYVAYLRAAAGEYDAYQAEGPLLGAKGKRGKPRKCVIPADILDSRIVDLSKTRIEEWKQSQVKRDPKDADLERRSKDTCNRILTMVKAALTRAFEDEANVVPTDAAWRTVKPFEDVGRARDVHFSPEEMQRLINSCSGRFRDLVIGGLLTGARIGELAQTYVGGFDARLKVLTVPDGKTGNRAITLNAEGVDFFSSITAGRGPDEMLFLKDDGEPWGRNHWVRPMKDAAKRARLPEGACYYNLRHTYASQAIMADTAMPAQVLAENMGTSRAMLEKHYAKVFAAKRHAMIEAGTLKLGLPPSNIVKMRSSKTA